MYSVSYFTYMLVNISVISIDEINLLCNYTIGLCILYANSIKYTGINIKILKYYCVYIYV